MGKENSIGVCSPFNDDNVERHFVLFAREEKRKVENERENKESKATKVPITTPLPAPTNKRTNELTQKISNILRSKTENCTNGVVCSRLSYISIEFFIGHHLDTPG